MQDDLETLNSRVKGTLCSFYWKAAVRAVRRLHVTRANQ